MLLCGTHGDGGVTGLTSRKALDREMYETECQCEELSPLNLETCQRKIFTIRNLPPSL